MASLTEKQITNLTDIVSQMQDKDKISFTKKAIESMIASLKLLHDYEIAEEQGLLLRLPCKVGTKVYVLDSECEGDPYDCHHDCDHCACNVVDVYTYTFDVCMCDDFGKSVFLTKEEAEKKLDSMQKGE